MINVCFHDFSLQPDINPIRSYILHSYMYFGYISDLILGEIIFLFMFTPMDLTIKASSLKFNFILLYISIYFKLYNYFNDHILPTIIFISWLILVFLDFTTLEYSLHPPYLNLILIFWKRWTDKHFTFASLISSLLIYIITFLILGVTISIPLQLVWESAINLTLKIIDM